MGSTPGRQRPAPLVPAMLNTLRNPAFTVLLPAWVCDAVAIAIFSSMTPFYVRYVIQPEYQTQAEHGLECCSGAKALRGDQFNWRCSSLYVLSFSVVIALVCAVLACPMWMLLVKKCGKINTWLLWSLTMALSNFLYIFLSPGNIMGFMFVCSVNGIPLSANFIANAVLADIIDYDEFLTGTRNEATYTMFKSFLPKICGVPAATIPLILMGLFGHVAPENGMVQMQPNLVVIFLRAVVPLFVTAVCILSFAIKRHFPLKTREILHATLAGIQQHEAGEVAVDPLSGCTYALPTSDNLDDIDVADMLNHFAHERFGVPKVAEGEDPRVAPSKEPTGNWESTLKKRVLLELIIMIFALGVSVACTCATVPLLESEDLAFLCSIFMICSGVSINGTAFALFRFRAVTKLHTLLCGRADANDIVARIVKHRDVLSMMKKVTWANQEPNCSCRCQARQVRPEALTEAEETLPDKSPVLKFQEVADPQSGTTQADPRSGTLEADLRPGLPSALPHQSTPEVPTDPMLTEPSS